MEMPAHAELERFARSTSRDSGFGMALEVSGTEAAETGKVMEVKGLDAGSDRRAPATAAECNFQNAAGNQRHCTVHRYLHK